MILSAFRRICLVIVLSGFLYGCSSSTTSSTLKQGTDSLHVLATTSIIADVVRAVAGDDVVISTLIPAGSDPHSFEPSPQDIAVISQVDLVFAHGAGLERSLQNLIESAGAQDKTVYVSEGVELRSWDGEVHEGETGHQDESVDPHTWTDPTNVLIWVDNIEHSLSAVNVEAAEVYQANATAYKAELEELDRWIFKQTEIVPVERRLLVSDHRTFGYFADRYDFVEVGTLISAFSSLAEPSAQELAQLEDAMKDFQVPAIFVGNTVNPDLAQRVADDTGVHIVFLYTGSLSEPGGAADSYLKYMRYNTDAIVQALK
jgi:ABC-type Zn uptake system ZnuABC Zn-binding protein ZnuA